MTDWPDDWFRNGTARAGAAQPGGGSGAAAHQGPQASQPAGSAEPTDQLPNRAAGPGPAAPLADPAYAEQMTRTGFSPRPYQAGGTGQPGGAGSPGGAGWAGAQGPAGSAWPEQPAQRTPGRSPRSFRSTLPAGPGIAGGSRLGEWQRWLRPRRLMLIAAVVVSALLIGTVATYFYLDSQLTRKNVLVDYAGRPAQGAGQNWLITGSDSRQGLTRAQIRRLATGYGIGGQRSDTIMLLHLPANGGRPVLISIPRDSYVPIPGYGSNKINAAFSIGGPALLAKTVEEVTGLRIDHYMGIGFGGFVHVVDAVGGVRMCLKTPLTDPAAGLHLHAGCQVLDGAQALGFVRSRHLYATQDLQRIQNQRLLLRALLRKLTSTGVLLNPFESLPAASGVTGTLTVDQGTSLYQLVHAAFALRNPITTTVPIGDANYVTPNAGDALLWDRAAALKLFTDLNTDQRIPKSLISGSSLGG